MAFYQVAVGGKVLAADLNQLIQTFTGIAANAVLMDGDTGSSYWFTVYQRNTANGLIALFKNSSGNLLSVTKNGTRLSVNGSTFDKVPLTTDDTQSVSNKTLDGTNSYSTLPGAALAALSVATAALADGSVTNAKIADATIEGKKLGPAEAALVYRSADVGVPTGTPAVVNWDMEEFDAGLHSPADNSKLTAITSGLFKTGGTISWQDEIEAFVIIELLKNGVLYRVLFAGYMSDNTTDVDPVRGFEDYLRLNAGDYIQIRVTHYNGATRSLRGGQTKCHWYICKKGS